MRPSTEPLISAFATTILFLATPGCSAAQLMGSEWRPTSVTNIKDPLVSEMFLRFEEGGKLAGNGGCNDFFGTYTITGDRTEIGPIGATRRACSDRAGQNEIQLFQWLAMAHRFERNGVKLSLFDESGALLAKLNQTDAD